MSDFNVCFVECLGGNLLKLYCKIIFLVLISNITISPRIAPLLVKVCMCVYLLEIATTQFDVKVLF